MKSSVTWLVILSAFVAGSAFAGVEQDKTPVTWGDLINRCLHPEQYQDQQEELPKHITLKCTDTQWKWQAATPGAIKLEDKRDLVSSVFNKKLYVTDQVSHPAMPGPKAGVCNKFVLVKETLPLETEVSCGELLNFKKGKNDDNDLSAFCQSKIDEIKSSDDKGGKDKDGHSLVTVEQTDQVVDTCAGVVVPSSAQGGSDTSKGGSKSNGQ